METLNFLLPMIPLIIIFSFSKLAALPCTTQMVFQRKVFFDALIILRIPFSSTPASSLFDVTVINSYFIFNFPEVLKKITGV